MTTKITPYTVIIDTREQHPYEFSRPLSWPGARYPMAVQTTVGTLTSGDYSLVGFEKEVAVERKSKADLFNTMGQSRARFQREIERLAEFKFAVIVIEAEWSEILADPPARSRLNPVTIITTAFAWQQRYPRVHWWPLKGRLMGEVATLRILDRFWRDLEIKGGGEKENVSGGCDGNEAVGQ